MDPKLLTLLPDAAKLGILRHLGSVQQQTQPEQPEQQHAPAQPPVHGREAELPPAVAGRCLAGGLAVIDGFMEQGEVEAARDEARAFLAERARAAGMVAAAPGQRWSSSAARGDQAAWLPGPDALEAGGHPALAAAVRRLAALQPWLAAQGHAVGGRPSYQLGCYPGGGARYVRHRDASASVPYRAVTGILYLNPDWSAAHGGALCVYNHSANGSDPCAASAADLRLAGAAKDGRAAASAGGAAGGGAGSAAAPAADGQRHQQVCSGVDEGHPATVVPPVGGRLVVMDSRLLHEVLPAEAERFAIAVWFSRAPPAAAGATGEGGDPQPVQLEVAAPAPAPPMIDSAEGAPAGSGAHQPPVCSTARPPAAAGAEVAAAGAAPPAAAQPLDGSRITAPGCIFVSVPAYRDSETQWTLADLFAKAAHPERVRVGVVWQVELPADAELVRQVVLPASEATGPCKARALAQQLWEGEEFHLQIDSHMRFVEGWDSCLLRMLSQAEAVAGHKRVVLSTYPAGYEGEGAAAQLPADPLPTVLCAGEWGPDGLLRLRGRKLRQPLGAPEPALFWAAGLSFSRAQLIQEAPYPRHVPWLFLGEELLQLLRMWQRGWDVFTPSQAVAFHLWSRGHRPTFQRDHQPEERHAEARRRSQQHVTLLLAGLGEGGARCGMPASGGGGTSGDGDGGAARGGRGLAAFWEHTGVNFRERSISARAQHGGLPPARLLSLADPCDYC